ncbi:MAG: energy-coupled thiamine transporter ThiT [Prevotella sp.]|nr:energy-coupled thiamine transporter ThiT [Staphylococcus sp.]MCM1350805.1 energy-coupled thiamine transporter ThiT [Prevotella sp.]
MKHIFGFTVRDIAEIAILCAIAVVLDKFVKLSIGATGGSINIAMVPLFIIALRHGWFKGLIAGGLVYGLISCLLDGYGLITYPLEYLVAFGSVAITGLVAKWINQFYLNKTTKSVILSFLCLIGSMLAAFIIRFICGSIDSVLLYDYTWSAAFVYNAPYVFISGAAVAVIMCLLLPSIVLLNREYPTQYLKGE